MAMTRSHFESRCYRGFSLIELSIVLIVFALLAGSLLPLASGQRQQQEELRAVRQLEQALEALYAHAVVYGHLPCPADPALAAADAQAGAAACPREYGVLPWQTLGLAATDPWGSYISYFADKKFTGPPAPGAGAGFGLHTEASGEVSVATGGIKLASQIPALLVCHGRNVHQAWRPDAGRNAGGSADEVENGKASRNFVDRLPDAGYDDLVRWVNPAVLKLRLVNAGRLP